MLVRPAEAGDLSAIVQIYQAGLDLGLASFEEQAPDEAAWDSKFLPECRFVAVIDSEIAGWIALAPVSSRDCYRGVAELSVYVAPEFFGRGVGRALMDELVPSSEAKGIWTLYSAIFPENEASKRLHIAAGFRVVGRRERIAQQRGVWRDTIMLERRSGVVGTD